MRKLSVCVCVSVLESRRSGSGGEVGSGRAEGGAGPGAAVGAAAGGAGAEGAEEAVLAALRRQLQPHLLAALHAHAPRPVEVHTRAHPHTHAHLHSHAHPHTHTYEFVITFVVISNLVTESPVTRLNYQNAERSCMDGIFWRGIDTIVSV